MKLTLALIAYRQERFIAEAVNSLLNQTCTDAEIILSDDASPDATFDMIRDAAARYDGPLTVRVRRNPENLGLAGHVNAVMQEARGDLVSLCAGDDIALPERGSLSLAYFEAQPDLSALALRPRIINDSSVQIGEKPIVPDTPLTVEGYFKGQQAHPSGAGRTYSRKVIETFGPLSLDCPTEDTTMLLRAMLLGEVRDFPDIGLMYRQHDTNLSRRASLRSMDLEAIRAQLFTDLDTALRIGLIDAQTRRAHEMQVEAYWARRQIAAKAQDDGIMAVLPALLTAKALPPIDRLRLGRRLLRSHLRHKEPQ